MKKLFYLLVASVVVALPLSAKAATNGPAGPLGIILECDKAQRVCDESDKCRQTCTIEVTKNPNGLTEFSGDLTLNTSNAKIVKMDVHSDWLDSTSSLNGTKVTVSFSPVNGKFTENKFKLATFQIELSDKDTDCSVDLSYKYEEQTTEVTTTTTVTKTGAALPIAIIAGGIGAVAVIYLATKKNKKMYKI